MNEEAQMYIDEAEEKMKSAVVHFEGELAKIRAGKATPAILQGISVDYYGTPTPLNQVANVGTTDARTIVVQPWEKTMLPKIEKEILKANLGLTPTNNGEILRIVIPALTEERRKALVKQVKQEAENARVAVRSVRKDTNNTLKSLEKDGLTEDESKQGQELVQKLTDRFVADIDKISQAKETEIMTV
ncbi:MAG: ribosome recycling factor [Bacteroidales bacterium]|nr:ribosome recycling factor [Bacteroidales bacterium]MBO7142837.1 ribosome recycling factor [Bacteroidales bacterium]